jgi:hypothetical protein
MTETEKFRPERLVARPWQIEDLPLAMELGGDLAAPFGKAAILVYLFGAAEPQPRVRRDRKHGSRWGNSPCSVARSDVDRRGNVVGAVPSGEEAVVGPALQQLPAV